MVDRVSPFRKIIFLLFRGDFQQVLAMIWTGVLASFLFSLCLAASDGDSAEGIPFVVASGPNFEGGKLGDSVSETERKEPDVPAPPLTDRGRGDVDIENDQPSGGYFYPKPSRPFDLPKFEPLSGDVPFGGFFSFAGNDEQAERLPRSPRRRPPHFPSPPPFIPGFIPPNQIRPLPALYGRPHRF